MAIAGLLIHTSEKELETTEAQITTMDGMTTYGCHQNQYVVVVAEAPSSELEARVKKIENLPGVLTIYTTYVTLEDETGDETGDEIDAGDKTHGEISGSLGAQ